jgi:uncharacterized membrane protein
MPVETTPIDMVANARNGSNWSRREAASRAASYVTVVTLAVAFGAMALGIPWFWVAFPVGFGGVLPLAVARAKRRTDEAGPSSEQHEDDALSALRERYARGEIDEREFESRVERLLETER